MTISTDGIDEAIRKTLGAVETIAPKAWELALRAQRIDADIIILSRAAWVVFVVAVALVFRRRLTAWQAGPYDGDMRTIGLLLVPIAASILVLLLLYDISCAVAVLANPDVYAARAIIGR